MQSCRPLLALALLATLIHCAEPAPPPVADTPAMPLLAGTWRAVLTSPGGELPFTLRITDGPGGRTAAALSGAEAAPFSGIELHGEQIVLRFDGYDSEVKATLSADGNRLTGRWRKTAPEGDSILPFIAYRGDEGRFLPAAETDLTGGDASALVDVGGSWAVTFRSDDGSEPARGELTQEGTHVTGTFLTPTGDYRFLEGSYEQGLLRLSTFDGAHAFLFHARAQADGSLEGDFWSRDSYHATWTAHPLGDDEQLLPDAWEVVGLTNDEGRLDFTFPDLEGNPVSLDDPRFAGKVVLVNIFGSWCPNCNDEAPLLAAWHKRYGQEGLEIVGLAYELRGDPDRDRIFVRRFAERYGLDYPLLLAGTSDKAAAADTLPDLTAVVAFPTSVFIGRDGKVRHVHTGFAGPGTGAHHAALVADIETRIEALLAE